MIVVDEESLSIAGITDHLVETLGIVDLAILNAVVNFHVVQNKCSISTDGILGRPYL